MKRLYVSYTVEGLNLDRLLNTLARQRIKLYRIRKINRKTLKFSLKSADKQKFFAITENMCYNVTESGEYGSGLLFALCFRNPGVLVGICVLAFTLFFGDRLLTGIEYRGTGSLYAAEAEACLAENGVQPYTFFFSRDCDVLARALLKNPHFSFASVKREGNRLVVELAVADEETSLFTAKSALYAPEAGIVEYIKLYRGTACVSVGDAVEKDAILLDGFVFSGETERRVCVFGEVGLLIADTAVVAAEKEEIAIALFCAQADRDYVAVSAERADGGFRVTGRYRRILYGGKD